MNTLETTTQVQPAPSLTVAQAIDAIGVDIIAEYEAEASVPFLDSLQFQGDVAVRPVQKTKAATTVVTSEGVPVIKGEAMGNTHLLIPGLDAAPDTVKFDFREDAKNPLVVGILTITTGGSAMLAHPEHGYSGVLPGTYEIRRQREREFTGNTGESTEGNTFAPRERLVLD